MVVAEEAVMNQTLAVLPAPPTFRRILKCFDTSILTILSSGPKQKITYTC